MSNQDGKTALWTPDGVQVIGEKQPERVELRAGVGEWLRQFADIAPALKLGLHCAECGNDIKGRNSDTDRIYALTCGCREFVWPNRDYREPPPVTKH